MPRRDLMQLRRGTAAEWAGANPVLASGEAGYEVDTGKLKYGNGVAPWSGLTYFAPGLSGGGGGELPASVTLLGNPISPAELGYLLGTTALVQNQIDAKAPTGHSHTIGAVTGLQASLDSKMPALLVPPSVNLTASGAQTTAFSAGATITAGLCVRLGASGKWVLTDADAAASSTGLLGLALQSKNDTEPMLVALPGSFVRVNSWNWTPGSVIYLDTTPGVLSETQPNGTDDVIRVIGYGLTADIMYFTPSADYITHI